LCTAAEETAAESKQHNRNYDHEDHEYRDDAGAAATTILTHEGIPPVNRISMEGAFK
jgi:hypothetical protein